MDALPETATQAEFARLQRWKPSYVSQLKREGRLVLSEDGKSVLVAESIARVAATMDPAKDGVRARHAAARVTTTPAPAPEPIAPQEPAGEPGAAGIDGIGYQHWRERSERAKALGLERDNAIAAGRLLDAGEVAKAVGSAATALRTRLEGLPDVLAPQLAPLDDEARIRGLLAEEIEHALSECARGFAQLGKEDSHA